MRTQSEWFVISGIVVSFAAPLALGVTGRILLLPGVALLSPAAMIFGMDGMKMNHGCAHSENHRPSALDHNPKVAPSGKRCRTYHDRHQLESCPSPGADTH